MAHSFNWLSGVLVVVVLAAVGCQPTAISVATAGSDNSSSRPTTRPLPVTRPAVVRLPPLLLHLPGIGGKRSIDLSMVRGLVAGGFKGEVQIYDWTEGDSGIDALRNLDRNHHEAELIAAQLVARHAIDPTAPIYLTCHSGGAGLAVWTLADLPSDIRVKSVIFLAPALSPTYDLTAALKHVEGHAYVFSSLADNLVLGYGTRLFGTIDGVKTDAAGRVGFTRPPSGDAGQYAKLVPLPYTDQWFRYRNGGDHVGGMTRAFGQYVLAPLVRFGRLPSTRPTSLSGSATGAN